MRVEVVIPKTQYLSGSGRLKGRPAKSGDVIVGSVSSINEIPNFHQVIVSINVQDSYVERVAKRGLTVDFVSSGGMSSKIAVSAQDVKKILSQPPEPPPEVDKSHWLDKWLTRQTPFQSAEKFRQEYLAEFTPEPPPPPALCWERVPSPDPGTRFECWPSTDKERIFYGATKDEAVARAKQYVQDDDPEVWKDPQIIRGRDFDQSVNINKMGCKIHPMGSNGPAPAAQYRPTPPPAPPPKSHKTNKVVVCWRRVGFSSTATDFKVWFPGREGECAYGSTKENATNNLIDGEYAFTSPDGITMVETPLVPASDPAKPAVVYWRRMANDGGLRDVKIWLHEAGEGEAIYAATLYGASAKLSEKYPHLNSGQIEIHELPMIPVEKKLLVHWSQIDYSGSANSFKAWLPDHPDRHAYGPSKEEAARRVLFMVLKTTPEKQPIQLVNPSELQQQAKTDEPAPISAAGWVSTPITAPGKAKYIIVEEQEVRPRADSDPDPHKRWICRPEGQMFPIAEGDTPEEAVDLLKLGNPALEPLKFTVVGDWTPSAPTKASASPRVERSLEM